MKKIYLLLLAVTLGFGTVSASEQAADTIRHNNFGACRDNWYIELAGGGNVLFSKDARLNYNEKNVTPFISFGAGKWFTPYIGFRLQIEGYSAAAGSDNSGVYVSSGMGSADEVTKFVQVRPDGSYVYPVYYMNSHVDMTLSLLSLINKGFSNKDHWDVIPSVGFGYNYVFAKDGVPASNTITSHFGITGKYRILPELDVNIFAQATLFPDVFEGRITGSVVDPLFSFGASLTYNINGHNFTGNRVAPKAVKKNLKNGTRQVVVDNTSLEKKIDDLSKQVEDSYKTSDAKEPSQNNYISYNIIAGSEDGAKQLSNKVVGSILFKKGTTIPVSEVNNQLVNVNEMLKAFPEAKIQLEGYADKDTGSAEFNKKLSEDRAAYVADLFKKNFNIPEDRIVIKAFGGEQKAYDSTNSEQRVVLFRIIF